MSRKKYRAPFALLRFILDGCLAHEVERAPGPARRREWEKERDRCRDKELVCPPSGSHKGRVNHRETLTLYSWRLATFGVSRKEIRKTHTKKKLGGKKPPKKLEKTRHATVILFYLFIYYYYLLDITLLFVRVFACVCVCVSCHLSFGLCSVSVLIVTAGSARLPDFSSVPPPSFVLPVFILNHIY